MHVRQAVAPSERIDWNSINGRVDLAAIATALLGPATKRSGRRLMWPCPFHSDHDPSLQVDPSKGTWKCWPCNLGGDAPALVMRLDRVGFPEAVRTIAELAGIVVPSGRPTRTVHSSKVPATRPLAPGRRGTADWSKRSATGRND